MNATIDQLIRRIDALTAEVAELKATVQTAPPASSFLSMREKKRIINEAHASGDRKRIQRAHRLINGESA